DVPGQPIELESARQPAAEEREEARSVVTTEESLDLETNVGLGKEGRVRHPDLRFQAVMRMVTRNAPSPSESSRAARPRSASAAACGSVRLPDSSSTTSSSTSAGGVRVGARRSS